MSERYSFPLLPVREIRDTFGELRIQVTEDDLANPAGWKVKQIYEQLIELLLNQRREDMAQPAFGGIAELEFPELHEESVPMTAFLKACHKLLSTSGISDFKLDDVNKPDPKRLRRNLSAIINFAKFREDRQPGYVEFTQETDGLAQQKAKLEEENERLLTEVKDAKLQRQREAPEQQELVGDNQKREVVVHDLFNRQTEVQNECQALKAELHKVQDAIKEANLKLLNAKEENEALKEQIVPDPRKLRCDLAALHDAEMTEKAALRALEAKLAQNAKQREALERMEREVDEVIGVQSEVEGEQGKLKEVQRQLKENNERASKDDGDRNDQQHQIKGLMQRNDLAKERIERLNEQHASRQKVAAQALADTQRAWSALEAERSQYSRQLEDNESAVRELRDNLLRGRMEHEAEVASVRQQQQLLAAQVRAYHTDLSSVMKTVASANQQLLVSRLTDAQIARTVAMVSGAHGVLCTRLAVDGGEAEGAAFPCPVPFVVDGSGCPLMPLASLEAGSNLQSSKLATFYARAPPGGAAAGSVVTLVGEVSPVAEADVEDEQLQTASQLAGAPAEKVAARKWVRLVPSRVHVFDAVREVEAWVPPAEYADAEPNPLADAATVLLSKMNTQFAEALHRFAAVYAGVPPDDVGVAELLSVDQMGFDLRVQLGPSAPTSVMRAGFKMPPANAEESTSIFMKLFQEAYERQNGFMS